MTVDKLSQRDAHLLLHSDGVVNVPRNAEEFGARVLGSPETIEPGGTTTHNRGAHRDSLNVGDRGGAAVNASIGWKWWLETGATRLAFERLDEGGLLPTDVGAGARVHVDVEVEAGVAGVLAEEALRVGLVDSALQLNLFVPKFAANIDVGSLRSHGEADEESALNEFVGVVAHNFAIFAGAGLRLVSVDDEILGAPI